MSKHNLSAQAIPSKLIGTDSEPIVLYDSIYICHPKWNPATKNRKGVGTPSSLGVGAFSQRGQQFLEVVTAGIRNGRGHFTSHRIWGAPIQPHFQAEILQTRDLRKTRILGLDPTAPLVVYSPKWPWNGISRVERQID